MDMQAAVKDVGRGAIADGPVLAGLAGIYGMHDPFGYGFETPEVVALMTFGGMIGAGIRSFVKMRRRPAKRAGKGRKESTDA